MEARRRMEVKKNLKLKTENSKLLGYSLFFLWAGFVFVKYVLILFERGKLRSIWPLF
jgi:hypothetical protein